MKKALAALVLVLGLALPVAVNIATASGSEQDCVPAEAYTETTDWVLQSPGDGWYQVDERTVTDQEAYDEVVTPAVEAQHYSLKGNSGLGKDDVPVFPADYWQANTRQEPHSSDNVTWVGTVGVGLHYTSHGSEGNRDWFYFEPGSPAVIVHHDAVTHEEFKFAFDHPEVKCPTDTPTPTVTGTPTPTVTPPPNTPFTPTWTPKPPKGGANPDLNGPLAHTGGGTGPATAAGLALASLGGALMYLTRRKAQRA